MNKIIPAALLAAALAAPVAPANAADVFIPGTRQPSQATTVGPHYADRYGAFDYVLDYDRDLAPLVGSKTLDQSVIAGAKTLVGYGGGTPVIASGDTVTGESQGAIVADLVKRYYAAQGAAAPTGLTFVTYGDPINARGGLLGIVTLGPQLLGMTPHRANMSTAYNTTTYVVRYDGFADAPNNASVLTNPIAWANAIIGMAMYHGTAYSAAAMTDPANLVSTTTNAKGATNTYVLHTMPGYLPIVQLGQKLGLLNPAQAFGTNKTLTKIVEAGYTRPSDTAITGAPVTPASPAVTSAAATKQRPHVKGPRHSAEADKTRRHAHAESAKTPRSNDAGQAKTPGHDRGHRKGHKHGH